MKKFLIVGFVLASLCAVVLKCVVVPAEKVHSVPFDFRTQSGKANGVEFKFEIQDGRATLTGTSAGSSIAGDLVLPQTLGGCPVTSIGSGAFYGCSGLTSVTIPPSVTRIGWFAFSGCFRLTSVTIPSSVTSIGWYAFEGCSGLTSVTIPLGVTSIGALAFWGCSGLTSVTIPPSVTNIELSAFAGFNGLKTFVVDKDNPNFSAINGLLCTKDGATVVAGVSGDVTIPPGVTDIGFCAFADCYGLTSVTIPLSVTSIGKRAFKGCRGLTSVTIPPSVTNIVDCAFEGCRGLKTVYTGKGDSDRVKNLLESSGFDAVPKLNFIESPAPRSN